MISTRWRVWGGLALLAGVAVVLAPPPADTGASGALVPAVSRPAPAGLRPGPVTDTGPAALPAATVLRLLPRLAETADPASRLWQIGGPPALPAPPAANPAPPPVVIAPPPPPPVPTAPPLPYRLIGRYADNERNGVILQGPDGQIVIAHAGQLLGEQYRIDSLVGNTMVLTYLPLNLHQTLDIGISR